MAAARPNYRGRFAPSPTGPLHAGSVVAALASWLDARAHGGAWLVRIEDVDRPRCPPGLGDLILHQLDQLGLRPDEPIVWQSRQGTSYQAALDTLLHRHQAYACTCSRSDVLRALAQAGTLPERHRMPVYPGTCRPERGSPGSLTQARAGHAAAYRLRIGAPDEATEDVCGEWTDRRHGLVQQNLSREVGDFVLRRADGCWAYQLAVVVDDAAQRITHVVRGDDLLDNTARQIYLQRCLGLPQPRYLHTPLVLDAHGEKLSKQTGARPVDVSQPLAALQQAGDALGLQCGASCPRDWLAAATAQWREQWV